MCLLSFQPLSNSDLNASEEAMHLANLVNGELAGALSEYEEPRVEGAGGSGLVISAIYKPFSTRRAIKIPRKRLFDMVTKEPPTVDVDPELHALSKISHENITRYTKPTPSFWGSRLLYDYRICS